MPRQIYGGIDVNESCELQLFFPFQCEMLIYSYMLLIGNTYIISIDLNVKIEVWKNINGCRRCRNAERRFLNVKLHLENM